MIYDVTSAWEKHGPYVGDIGFFSVNSGVESVIVNIVPRYGKYKSPALVDISVGLCAGLAATQVTNLAQRPLSWITPEHVDRHEKRVRPGASSSLAAAQKISKILGISPSQREAELWSKAIHFGIGMDWGPVYGLLRQYGGFRPFGAALTTGVAMSLLLDETLVPALGLSATPFNVHH